MMMHIKDLFSLENKIILITGGEGKYGKYITEALAEAGATVITASPFLEESKKVAEEFRFRGLDVLADYVDQGHHDSVIKLKNKIKEKYDKFHVLVNCAVARPMKTYDSPLEDWEESMRINATGLFDVTREMAKIIDKSGYGSIINICSMMGMFGPDLSNYDDTDMRIPPPDYFFHKGGLLTLTRYLARVLADDKIRVNSISPGGLFSNQPDQFIRNYIKKVPLGRMAGPDDIKGVIVFLASDASSYINGENILMDGGMHA